ncbi:MAG: SEC-C metal-binding domain-containing protein [Planctomycetota bacterium]|nr:SEC-C metal-binding domain-containing protein [Planctomycetota bacterium]
MTSQNSSLIERLIEAGSPNTLPDWEEIEGYYVTACRISQEDVPGLIDIMQKWPDPNWPTEPDLAETEDADMLPVLAWRTLGDMKADAAVQPLLDMLRGLPDDYDDWVFNEVPHVFGKIGEPAVEQLEHFACDQNESQTNRTIAICGMRRVAEYYPALRQRIVASLTAMMASARGDTEIDIRFNTTLLAELCDLQAVEAAEAIERAFAANMIDHMLCGDWNAVREELGVEGLGLEMPEHPFNSTEQILLREGRGIFSDRDIFLDGDTDYDAARAYYDKACEAFSDSPEGQQIIERHNYVNWVYSLLNFGISHLGEVVDQMTPESIEEYLFDFVPRKVSTLADSAPVIIDELARFWEFVDRVYQLPSAKAIVEVLTADGLVDNLKRKMSDPKNFGMAKSFFISGTEAGYDMTSEEGLAQFTNSFNRSLSRNQFDHEPEDYEPVSEPIVRSERVGRNDPCPCGSGKKFKKCCIR